MVRGIPALAVRAGPYLLLVALFLLRVVHLRADAPYFLDWSGGLYFDEGAYTHNARNKLLFGAWRLDSWNNMYYSPLHNLLVYASFSLFGVGFLQERLVPTVLSGLSLWLFYLALRQAFGLPTALVGAVLLGTNYLFLMFGRLGLFEIPQIFAGVLTLWAFGRAVGTGARAWYFAAGAASFLFYVFKNLGAYFVAAALVSAVYVALTDAREGRGARLAAFGGGLAAAVAVWGVAFYLPSRQAIASIGSLWITQSIPASAAQLGANLVTQPFFVAFARIPVVLGLGVLGLALVVYLALRAPARLHGLDVLAGAWLAAGAAALALLSYRPVRYYVPLIPPLCYLAARVAVGGLVRPAVGERLRRDPALYLVLALAAWTGGVFGVFTSVRSLGFRALCALGLAAAVVGLVLVALRPRAAGERRLPVTLAWAAAALVVLAVGLDLYQYRQWQIRPVYGMVRISKELGRLASPAVIAGLATPALVLENGHRAIYAGREGWFDATPDLFQRHPEISHLLLATYNAELHWYYRTFPEVMARARLLKIYHVWKTYLFLYSLRDGETPRPFHPVADTDGYDATIQAVEFPFAVEPGQSFSVRIAVRNAGRAPWRGADRIGLGTREQKDAFTEPRHFLAAGQVTRPDEVVTFSLPMRAPTRPDLYVSAWQMVREGAFWFGEPYLGVIWVKEKV